MQLIKTETGTSYMLDGRKITRTGGAPMRHDGETLSGVFWGEPTIGKRMRIILKGKQFDGGSTLRVTTPVVSIETVEE